MYIEQFFLGGAGVIYIVHDFLNTLLFPTSILSHFLAPFENLSLFFPFKPNPILIQKMPPLCCLKYPLSHA